MRRKGPTLGVAFGLLLGLSLRAPSAYAAQSKESSVAAVPNPSPSPQPPREITGEVLDPEGRPIDGALIYTFPSVAPITSLTSALPPFPWRSSEYRSTTTGRDGRFVLAYSRTPVNLRAEAPPFAPVEILNATPGAPVVLRLTAGLTQAGRVFHALTGEPLAGIEVSAGEVGLRMPVGAVDLRRASGITDRGGRFRVRGLSARPHTLSLQSAAFVLASGMAPFVPGSKDLVLTARPGATWRGRVTDPEGRPVSGAAVSLSTSFKGDGPSTQADAKGKFELAVLPGRYTLTVTHQDFAPHSVEGLTAVLGSAETLTVQMKTGATVGGRIVDEEGSPLAGRVRLRLFGRPLPLFGAQDLGDLTSATDRFTLPHVPAGQHEVDFMAEGRAGVTIPVMVAAPQGALDLGDIRLESGLSISGRVINEAGDPVPGARVTANASRDASRSQPFETASEPDGRFVISGINEGRYLLSASADGHSSLANLRAGSGDLQVTVTLRRNATVRLRLTQGAGTEGAVRPVRESVLLVGQPLEPGTSPLSRAEQAPNESGEVTFENMTPGRQILEIGATGYVRKNLGIVNVEAGGLTDLGQVRLERGFAVRGRVVDATGRPIRGADVDAPFRESNRIFQRRAVSDGDGRFEITGVEPGEIELTASHPAYATSRATVTVEADGSSLEVVIPLRGGGRIAGTVRRKDGQAVAGVFVSYATPGGGSVDWRRTRGETDAMGAFVLENIVPGRITVSVLHGQAGRFEPTMSAQVVVREGEESTINFVLRETVVRGRISGPAARAKLRVRLSPGFAGGMYGGGSSGSSLVSAIPRGSAFTDSEGRYELMVDQPGRYFAEVTSYDGSEVLVRRTIEVPDADALPLDFVVGGSRVVVTVLDEASRAPVADALVTAAALRPQTANESSPSLGSGTTGTDGRAVLYLSEGDYTVGARSPAHAPGSVSARVAGDTEIALSLEAGLKISGRVRTRGGLAPPGYYVTAGPVGGGQPRAAQRMAGGSFEVSGLRPGRYRLHASAADDFGEAEVEAGTGDVEIELRPGGTVSVLVVDALGRPASRASVAFANERGEPLSNVVYYASEEGRVVMPVPAQRVIVNVRQQELVGRGDVVVSPGETVEVRVVIEAPPR